MVGDENEPVKSKKSTKVRWMEESSMMRWIIKTKIFANIFTKAFERMLLGSHPVSILPLVCVLSRGFGT